MNVVPVGRSALLVEVADTAEALSLALWARANVAADDIVPAAATVLIDGCRPDEVRGALAGWRPSAPELSAAVVDIPVVYDGPDLDVVAQAWSVATSEVGPSHAAVEHVAAFCGFAPGFAYLTGSPGTVPRRDTPRQRVEPGSVALAGPFTGIYPTASPGGWQLIGHTDARLWDASRDQPALLPPGTRVRFVPA